MASLCSVLFLLKRAQNLSSKVGQHLSATYLQDTVCVGECRFRVQVGVMVVLVMAL